MKKTKTLLRRKSLKPGHLALDTFPPSNSYINYKQWRTTYAATRQGPQEPKTLTRNEIPTKPRADYRHACSAKTLRHVRFKPLDFFLSNKRVCDSHFPRAPAQAQAHQTSAHPQAHPQAHPNQAHPQAHPQHPAHCPTPQTPQLPTSLHL